MIRRRTVLGILASTCLPASLARAALREPEFFKEKLADGLLPPMTERIPKVPRVVNLAAMGRTPGQYGGQARMIIGGQKDIRLSELVETLTTLPAQIVDASGKVVAKAQVKFDVRADLLKFLASWKPLLPRLSAA